MKWIAFKFELVWIESIKNFQIFTKCMLHNICEIINPLCMALKRITVTDKNEKWGTVTGKELVN